jgi:hypothetical protein
VSGSRAADVEVAEQLDRDAQALFDGGGGSDSLTLAVDQLHADRTNGEPLATAIRRLRDAIDEERDTRAGGAHE